jgi:hypothetical protein
MEFASCSCIHKTGMEKEDLLARYFVQAYDYKYDFDYLVEFAVLCFLKYYTY